MNLKNVKVKFNYDFNRIQDLIKYIISEINSMDNKNNVN